MSGYTSEFLKKDGVLKSHLNLLHLAESVTNKNFQNGKFNFCKYMQ